MTLQRAAISCSMKAVGCAEHFSVLINFAACCKYPESRTSASDVPGLLPKFNRLTFALLPGGRALGGLGFCFGVYTDRIWFRGGTGEGLSTKS